MDSRALSKLGVYIPKPDLNSFFIRDDFDGKLNNYYDNIMLYMLMLQQTELCWLLVKSIPGVCVVHSTPEVKSLLLKNLSF